MSKEKVPDTGEIARPEELDQAEQLSGKTGSDPDEQRLMHSVLEHDDQEFTDGTLVAESFDHGLSTFQPDLLFDQLTKNYQTAKQLYGETMIRALTGFNADYVEKNINIPEFKQELQQRITLAVDQLQKKGYVDDEGEVTHQGVKLAAVIRYTEELDRLESQGLGTQERKERAPYGERDEIERFRRGKHRFHDIEMRQSIKRAIRRGHTGVLPGDLVASERQERTKLSVIYAIDSSGSMKGKKIRMAKQAGIALAYKAIQDKNEVGLIVFTSKIEHATAPCADFIGLLQAITVATAGRETDIGLTIEEAIRLFDKSEGAKHLVLLTDAVPTKTTARKGVRQRVLEAVSSAREAGLTISLIGISLDDEGERLARRIVEVGDGKLYLARETEGLDAIILEDYERFKR